MNDGKKKRLNTAETEAKGREERMGGWMGQEEIERDAEWERGGDKKKKKGQE